MAFFGKQEAKGGVDSAAAQAGDALIFTEAVLHGTLPWMSEEERRTVIYRFAPAGTAYGRGDRKTEERPASGAPLVS